MKTAASGTRFVAGRGVQSPVRGATWPAQKTISIDANREGTETMNDEIDVEHAEVIAPDGNVRLSQIQWIGLAGAAATFVGLFTPLYGWLTWQITLASLGWPAIVTGIAAVAAAWFIVRRHGLLSLISGLVALGVSLYLLIRTEVDKASMTSQFPAADSGDEWPLGNGVTDMVDAVIAPQWGWAVLLLGIAAILISSVAMMRSEGRHVEK